MFQSPAFYVAHDLPASSTPVMVLLRGAGKWISFGAELGLGPLGGTA